VVDRKESKKEEKCRTLEAYITVNFYIGIFCIAGILYRVGQNWTAKIGLTV